MSKIWMGIGILIWCGGVSIVTASTEKGEALPEMKISFEKMLSTKGSTRGSAYAMSNKIITLKEKGKIVVAWLDYVADTKIATYDIGAKTWSAPLLLGKGEDNHGGPALTMDSQGYLYVIFGPHHNPFQLRRSTNPYDATKFEPAERFGYKATYPSLICDPNDTLHLTYRGNDLPTKKRGGGWWLMYQNRPKGGKWSKPRALFKPKRPFKYTQFGAPLAVSKEGIIHMAFHVYAGDPLKAKGTHLGYLRTSDAGQTWETVNGEKVKLPATRKTPCFIEKNAKFDMRTGGLVLDPKGRPWLTSIHLEGVTRKVLLWHLESKEWKSLELNPFIAKNLTGRGLCQATLTFDQDGRLYVLGAVNVSKKKAWWGEPELEVVLFTSDDEGKSFKMLPISKPNPKVANWLPSIERPYGANPIGIPSLLFTSGDKGQFGKNKEGIPTKIYFVKVEKK